MDAAETSFVRALGHEVRNRRHALGLTLAALSEASGLSARFLADVEGGRANISVVKLFRVARALATSAAELLASPTGRPIALLGLRGAGKSTVGRQLAARLGLAFVELDQLVEERAGLPLPELFAVHGESYYRRVEGEALDAFLAQGAPAVLATGGGLVTRGETYGRLKRACATVWLRATPDDHMNRVLQQGDLRPFETRPNAMAELRQILAARAPLYAEAALIVDTSGVSLTEVVDEVAAGLEKRGFSDRETTSAPLRPAAP